MNSEFSGGSPEYAYESSDSEDSSVAVRVIHFDPTSLDKLSELINDHLKTDGDILETLPAIVDLVGAMLDEYERRGGDSQSLALRIPAVRKLCSEALRRMVTHFQTAKKVRLLADQIAWISELGLMSGESLGRYAARNGISKQAFQQGAEILRAELYDQRSQTRRTDTSRERMRQRNHRNGKPSTRFLAV